MGAFSLIVVINLLNRMFIRMLSALKLHPCSSLSARYINVVIRYKGRNMPYKNLPSFESQEKKNEKKIEVASRKNEKAPQNASESFGVTAEPVQKTSEKDSSKRHVKDAKGPVKDAKNSLKDTIEEILVLDEMVRKTSEKDKGLIEDIIDDISDIVLNHVLASLSDDEMQTLLT